MRDALNVRVDCGDVGRRVTVRVRLSSGGFSDIVGVLETCDEDRFGIRDRSGRLRRVDRSEIAAAKVVSPHPAPRRRTPG